MDASVFPATQLYLPLAFTLTIVSITATVMLSNNTSPTTRKALTGLWPPFALSIAFLHVYIVCVVLASSFLAKGHFIPALNLLVHVFVLFVTAKVGMHLSRHIANNKIGDYTRETA